MRGVKGSDALDKLAGENANRY
ncbi:hypothetical protein BQ8794_200106 [Mesorhizobium prunaredense]|uniref:Uncharacterized protein n=1 Tax=Mesorhizobium prunaredense TaxID=1631249 RepID=A0A1R3V5B6_9HYPH|nr:hypothetical protein BQ8794_200106 [Mesorhizobium prunaredense]